MGVSGQAKKLWVSVTGGWALLPAARRWAGEATVIGEVTAGWQTGVRAWAATTRDEKEMRKRGEPGVGRSKRYANGRTWGILEFGLRSPDGTASHCGSAISPHGLETRGSADCCREMEFELSFSAVSRLRRRDVPHSLGETRDRRSCSRRVDGAVSSLRLISTSPFSECGFRNTGQLLKSKFQGGGPIAVRR